MRSSLARPLVAPFTLLLLASCEDVSGESPSQGAADSSQGRIASEAPSDSEWSAVVAERISAEEAAFHLQNEDFLAVQALSGLGVRVGREGTTLTAGADEVVLQTRVDGQSGWRAPGVGDCVESGETDAADNCIPRIERAAEAATEWWHSTPGKVQVGWDISESEGPVTLRIGVQGAEIVPGSSEGEVVFRAASHDLTFGGLTAWDNNGDALDAWMEIFGDEFLVRVDAEDAVFPVHIDPVTFTAGWSASGPSGGYFGRSVAGIGDVNFDGYADVAVGAPQYTSNTGRVYVYHGSSSGLSTSASTTLNGAATSSSFGRSVDGAGDVDGDGFDDLIVGADGVSSNAGAAFIFYGSATGVGSVPGTTLSGVASSQFGYAVSSAGDANHDGYDDVIVGAFAAGSPSNIGAAYIFHGATTGLSTTPTTTLSGVASQAAFGIDVDNAGDVNGDGYGDVIVGASTYSGNTGYAEVYLGSFPPRPQQRFPALQPWKTSEARFREQATWMRMVTTT